MNVHRLMLIGRLASRRGKKRRPDALFAQTAKRKQHVVENEPCDYEPLHTSVLRRRLVDLLLLRRGSLSIMLGLPALMASARQHRWSLQ